MFIHLSDVLSAEGKTVTCEVPVGFDAVSYHGRKRKLVKASPMKLVLHNAGDKKVEIDLSCELSLKLPCDRCLEMTEVNLSIDSFIEIDMNEPISEELSEEEMEAERERMDNQTFVEGYQLDCDKLLMEEIRFSVPEKILCKEDCKGICYSCGKNLNLGPCGCEDKPKDLQMSAILDLFNSFNNQ